MFAKKAPKPVPPTVTYKRESEDIDGPVTYVLRVDGKVRARGLTLLRANQMKYDILHAWKQAQRRNPQPYRGRV